MAGPAGTTVVVRYANALFPRPWTNLRAFDSRARRRMRAGGCPSLDVPPDVPLTSSLRASTETRHQDDRWDGYDNRGAPPGSNPNGPPNGPPDRRYDHRYDDGGYRGPNDRGPPGRGGNWGTSRGGPPGGGFDPNAGNPAVMHRPSMMHGGGGYPNARPSMMHGPGAGHNKRDRPSLAPNRDRGGYDEGEIGEISEMRDGSVSREPWDAGNRDQRWGQGASRGVTRARTRGVPRRMASFPSAVAAARARLFPRGAPRRTPLTRALTRGTS
jgi:hypothetical protein